MVLKAVCYPDCWDLHLEDFVDPIVHPLVVVVFLLEPVVVLVGVCCKLLAILVGVCHELLLGLPSLKWI